MGGIPMAEMESYCRLFGVQLVERFVEFIRALDGEYLAFHLEESKSAAK